MKILAVIKALACFFEREKKEQECEGEQVGIVSAHIGWCGEWKEHMHVVRANERKKETNKQRKTQRKKTERQKEIVEEGEGVGEEPDRTTAINPGPLKIFNTL
jgi:hypothetical protein